MNTNHFFRVIRPFVLFTTLGICLCAMGSAARAGVAARGDRYNDLIIEFLALEPQVEVHDVGDGPRRPQDGKARLTAFLYNLRDTEVYAAVDWGGAAERQEIGNLLPGESKAVSISIDPESIPYDRPIIAQVYNMEVHKLQETDRAMLHSPRAMRVALLVERRTWDAGNKKFGSFTRYMRNSLESLHDRFTETTAPAQFGLKRDAIQDRFRIERVELFDRPADSMDTSVRPPIFDEHPAFDVVVVCDEGGPFVGYWPRQQTVGHNLSASGGASGFDSPAAEQTFWKALMQFRGVPDYADYRVAAGALPGRANEAIDVPEALHDDLMSSPATSSQIGALAAAIANANAGVSRLGDASDPSNEFARTLRWIPGKVRVRLVGTDGKPMQGVKVSWIRSLPISAGEADHGIAANRTPDGAATTSAAGDVIIDGDYLGIANKPGKQSRWLLVEAESAAGERRFGIISGLWLNAVYAAGSKDEAVWEARFDRMRTAR